jgi:hypothetical protein
VLSDANYDSPGYGRPHEAHPYTKYYGTEDYEEFHVMMIKWGEHGIAQRVGLGRLHGEAVGDAWGKGAVWKEIRLG